MLVEAQLLLIMYRIKPEKLSILSSEKGPKPKAEYPRPTMIIGLYLTNNNSPFPAKNVVVRQRK